MEGLRMLIEWAHDNNGDSLYNVQIYRGDNPDDDKYL